MRGSIQLRAAVVMAALGALLVACGGDDSSESATATDPTARSTPTPAGDDPSVDEADVEKEVERVFDGGGSTIEDVDCPGDLAGQVGATLECTATIDGKAETLKVVVTSAEDATTEFDVEIVD